MPPLQVNSVAKFNAVIFKDKANASLGKKFVSLFPGLGYAAGYKVLQRIYKYGGQPIARDYLTQHYGSNFEAAFGKKTGKALLASTAGSLIGIGEIILLPLDVLKIKRQTNPEAFRGRGVLKIVRDEGFGLYRGWGWTAARNAPGSFAVSGRYLSSICRRSLLTCPALRWFRFHKGVRLRPPRLQQGLLVPELHRLDCRFLGLADRLGSPRRHQDPYPEQELRQPRERHPDSH